MKKINRTWFQKRQVKILIKFCVKLLLRIKAPPSLADVYGYYVGGKTGTSQNYKNKNENLNTLLYQFFPSHEPKYALLVMLENPQVAKNLIYNYRGMKS